ncbi:MAG: hypothetical protein IAB82_08600 [Bacteroidetes bacterium]|uniref:Outer membrane protein beta-barrel domain-containing protein n=1 Tax=Candidatus Cryptobacteroides faecavium TaxID=2840762 RepID=A0A9D9IGK5_9BACT|nr:hypothetical protein [Candidatus Cryptobacteroides faecavium]
MIKNFFSSLLIMAAMLGMAAIPAFAASSESETETVSAVHRSKKQKKEVVPFDRGIGRSKSVFIPKGTIGAGVSFSYNNYSIGNAAADAGYSMLFNLLGDIHGNLLSFGISPYASYFIADNLSVGARFDYDRSSMGLNNLSLSLSDELGFSVKDFNYFKQTYTGALTLRTYLPFANSKRFAMFTEIRATGGYGQAESYKLDEGDKFGTYQDIYSFELGLVPGLCAFVTNEVALEVAVGLLGFNYQKVAQHTNQVDYSEMERSGANFKLNIFSISFGLSFYIPTGDHRVKKNKD